MSVIFNNVLCTFGDTKQHFLDIIQRFLFIQQVNMNIKIAYKTRWKIEIFHLWSLVLGQMNLLSPEHQHFPQALSENFPKTHLTL